MIDETAHHPFEHVLAIIAKPYTTLAKPDTTLARKNTYVCSKTEIPNQKPSYSKIEEASRTIS
jgi:hypothetical protein